MNRTLLNLAIIKSNWEKNKKDYIDNFVPMVANLNIIEGFLPAKVRGLVEEWAELHQTELLNMWETKKFYHLKPLV
jgi:hypothetical protein